MLAAVKALNRALLAVDYNIAGWDIPDGYLCPPIPGRVDYLRGLKENVIIGRLIPAGTGMEFYRKIRIPEEVIEQYFKNYWPSLGMDKEAFLELAREPGVTLAYRRERGAGWPYNLYCMVHGRDRASVLAEVARLQDQRSRLAATA